MRVFSSILFALMAVVLPMAGVPQYFCTMTMAFVDGAEECPVNEEKDCCGKEGETRDEAPGCMTVAKVLPHADLTAPTQIPAMDTEGIFIEVVSFGGFPADRFETIHPPHRRGPPDPRRIYVVQRKLLI